MAVDDSEGISGNTNRILDNKLIVSMLLLLDIDYHFWLSTMLLWHCAVSFLFFIMLLQLLAKNVAARGSVIVLKYCINACESSSKIVYQSKSI